MANFEPVDYDPFAPSNASSGSTPEARPAKFEPVDYDPFASKPQQVAPASGVFPAVSSSTKATVPEGTFEPGNQPAAPSAQIQPQTDSGVSAPTPSTTPSTTPTSAGDPGILAEAYGDAVKGTHATKVGGMLSMYSLGMYDDVPTIAKHIAESKNLEAMYPTSQVNRDAQAELEKSKDSGAGGLLPSLGVYARNPRLGFSQFVQSAPGMLASLVTVPVGAIAGSLVGPGGAVTGGYLGMGAGSAAVDYGAALKEYAQDKWKLQTEKDWEAFLRDPAKFQEAHDYAKWHSAVVGVGDVFGAKIGGKIGGKIVADRIASPTGRVAATAVAGAPASAVAGSVFEAGGQAAGTTSTEGAPRIMDPGGVIGEGFGGLIGDVAGAGMESAIKATGLGAKASKPATPENVAKALQAMMETPTPEQISGSMSVRDTPGFYSPARKYIEEKGPNAATSDQWLATLRNAPGVKEEELRDIGLDRFLAENPKPSKQEVLGFLDENAIRVEVTEYNNKDYVEPTEPPGTPAGWGHVGGAPPAKYEGYTLPGERDGYSELTFHLPTRNVEGDNTQRDFVGGHYGEPNVIAHARVTERKDVNGVPFALAEEIQSDWHQQGRKQGYRTPEPARDFDSELGALAPQVVEIMQRVDRAFNAYMEHNINARDLNNWGRARWARNGGKISDEEFDVIQQYTDIEEARRNPTPEYAQEAIDGPFKQSWPELAFKQTLKWAAERGYRRIAWVNGAEQSRRYPGDPRRDMGMKQFYDKAIPSIAKKWARRLGGTYGVLTVDSHAPNTTWDVYVNGNFVYGGFPNEARAREQADLIGGEALPAPEFNRPNTLQYIDIPQAGVDVIQRGLPLYSEVNGETSSGNVSIDELATPEIKATAQDFREPLQALVKGFKLPVDVKLVFHKGRTIKVTGPNGRVFPVHNALGMAEAWTGQKTNGYIHIALGYHENAAQVWATIVHELGHIVQEHKFETAPVNVQIAIRAAYDEWKSKVTPNQAMNELIRKRDNAVVVLQNMRRFSDNSTLAQQSKDKREYWVSFEEWFAENVARWGTSNQVPLTVVDKFFKQLGTLLRNIFKAASEKFNLPFEPAKAMADWLNSFHTDAQPFAENIITQTTVKTTADNQRRMGPDETAAERQPETTGAREGIDKLFGGRPPGELKEAAAYADKFNKIYKWALGIHQVADRNKHIAPLQEYVETISVAQLVKQQIMIKAQEVSKAWNKLGETQADNVAALIDDIQNMVYLSIDEVKNKVARFPTQAELDALAKKHNVTEAGLEVFGKIGESFREYLTRYEAVLVAEANKITDLTKRQNRLNAIARQLKNLRSKPYFPAMRFGDYTITIRNAAGHVIHFETFERQRDRDKAADAIKASPNYDAANKLERGKLDRQARPLVGVPTQLLEFMEKKLKLSPAQRDAMEQLKFELSPAESFKHRFQHKRRIAGYSQDFRRAYAAYFFHGANHLMKAQFADRLRGLAVETKAVVKGTEEVTRRHEIVSYMDDHLENWLDPKSDWAAIRSIAFIWALAWSPAAAMQNLTQTLMTTGPFLAAQFGDVKALAAIATTMKQFSTWYKKGTLENHTDFELKAIGRGIQEGLINEAMAPELAGYAEGGTLGKGFGGNELQRGLNRFNELGAKMFETAEQINRRIVFRATLKLAQANPDAKYVKASVDKHKLHYDQLRQEGWTEAEASAYVAARDATITTQFQYGREYAPRMFRGKARAIFVFKTFIQSYVMFLSTYPAAAVRSILVMGALGGLMGLPGGEDLRELLKAVAWQLFGKDFDLDREARRMMIQMFGNTETSREAADMILHGISRQGFMIPTFMDMLGGTVGVDIPMPTFDRSAALSAGTLLPVELGKLFGPPTNSNEAVIAGQAQKASGAVFGAGFNIYKAITNSKIDATDWKRWDRAVPRGLASLNKAQRIAREGRERTSTGSTLVEYDVRDPQELMEVIGIAMGYTPYRQSLQWNRIMAGQEVVKLWDIQRTGLMKQMGNAVLGKDQREIAKVRESIMRFNSSLPLEARGKAISSESLKQSLNTQARTRAAQEAESSVRKSDIPILREVQKLYPESQRVSVRRVRGSGSSDSQ